MVLSKKNIKKLPSISIITSTLNANLELFEKVLVALKSQDYPQSLIEHLVFDSGSTNGTIELAKKYGCSVTIRRDLKVQEQVKASLSIKKAKNDLILVLQSDNIPVSSNWLKEMVRPYLDDPKIFCTFSAYNAYEKNMSLTTRYGAFFGTADPTLYYLRKSEKIPLLQKNYDKGKILKKKSKYWVVEFDHNSLPTLGDNGHMFLRSAMSLVNNDPEKYVHLDMFVKLLDLDYNRFGVVKNTVVHAITPDISSYVKRRFQLKKTFFDGRRGARKYLVFSWRSNRDILHLLLYGVYSATLIYPLYESIRGYIRIRDKAWFLHPFMSPVMLAAYGFSEIRWFFDKWFYKTTK